MICNLRLYLKGVYFTSKEVFLSGNNPDLSLQDNFEIRESELKSQAEIFRIEHYRQIIKMQYEYCIVAVFKSKMGVDLKTEV